MFNDKHLSWNWEWARKMYDTSREMGFALHGRVQSAGHVADAFGRDAAGRADLAKLCASATAASTATIFMASKPSSAWWSGGAGGETGVKWVQAYRGDKFWDALREGVWPRALMDAALAAATR